MPESAARTGRCLPGDGPDWAANYQKTFACLRQLGLPDDAEHVNPHGGAIALGHPLGMSGAPRAHPPCTASKNGGGKLGLATMFVGVGQGVSVALERVHNF
jgi:3-oxoadipyl-CoA thiolase